MLNAKGFWVLTILVNFVLVNSAVSFPVLTVFDINDSKFKESFLSIPRSVDDVNVVNHGSIRFFTEIESIRFYQDNYKSGLNINIVFNIKSLDDDFLYKNKLYMDAQIGVVDINWASSYFSMEKLKIMDLGSESNPFYLREGLDDYVKDTIIKGRFEEKLRGIKFKITPDNINAMNDHAKYILRLNGSNITLDIS
jgi:hypothetical protein